MGIANSGIQDICPGQKSTFAQRLVAIRLQDRQDFGTRGVEGAGSTVFSPLTPPPVPMAKEVRDDQRIQCQVLNPRHQIAAFSVITPFRIGMRVLR